MRLPRRSINSWPSCVKRSACIRCLFALTRGLALFGVKWLIRPGRDERLNGSLHNVSWELREYPKKLSQEERPATKRQWLGSQFARKFVHEMRAHHRWKSVDANIIWELLSHFLGERRWKIFLGFQAIFFGRKTPQNDLSRVPHCGFKGWNLQLANPLQQGLLVLIRWWHVESGRTVHLDLQQENFVATRCFCRCHPEKNSSCN